MSREELARDLDAAYEAEVSAVDYLIDAGWRKLTLDAATVERALDALLFAMWGPGNPPESTRISWRSTARAVLAAVDEGK